MKRSSWLLIFLLAGTICSQEVKHAPVDKRTQCRADQRSWLSTLNKNATSVSFKELYGWHHAMLTCGLTVDPQFQRDYLTVVALIDSEQATRLEAFVRRHNLYDQFIAEDEQGKRRSSE
jgi:hypothetical protein